MCTRWPVSRTESGGPGPIRAILAVPDPPSGMEFFFLADAHCIAPGAA